MIETILIINIVNLIGLGFLIGKEIYRMKQASAQLNNISKVMDNVNYPPFDNDWADKLLQVRPSSVVKRLDETPDPESGIIQGHILDEIAANDLSYESSEERELRAEIKTDQHFNQERNQP